GAAREERAADLLPVAVGGARRDVQRLQGGGAGGLKGRGRGRGACRGRPWRGGSPSGRGLGGCRGPFPCAAGAGLGPAAGEWCLLLWWCVPLFAASAAAGAASGAGVAGCAAAGAAGAATAGAASVGAAAGAPPISAPPALAASDGAACPVRVRSKMIQPHPT